MNPLVKNQRLAPPVSSGRRHRTCDAPDARRRELVKREIYPCPYPDLQHVSGGLLKERPPQFRQTCTTTVKFQRSRARIGKQQRYEDRVASSPNASATPPSLSVLYDDANVSYSVELLFVLVSRQADAASALMSVD